MAKKLGPDRAHLTMGDVHQHVHQHQPEPRDLDYRAQAFAFAIQALAGVGGANYLNTVIQTAERIEDYLRNGKADN